MSLKAQIDGDIKKAMLAKDKETLTALRGIKSLILLAETDKGSGDELTSDIEIKLLTKAAKQRKDSAEIYQNQGRNDLASVELKELEVIERYLPKQLSEEELTVKLNEIISRSGASSSAEIGKVMGLASKELAGLADNKLISTLAKKLLE
jgi:uncharacterized protein YqeY